MLGRITKQVSSSLTVDGYLAGGGCLAAGSTRTDSNLQMEGT